MIRLRHLALSTLIITLPFASSARAEEYRLFFIGNSLSRGLSLASGQDRARIEGLFAARGDRMIFGTQLGAGVNLDEHWAKRRLSTGVALQLTHMDDLGETSESDGVSYAFSFFRDYQFAFQGKQRDADGTILEGQVFDAVILQPYQSLLEVSHYVAADQSKGFRGDRAAIRDFIGYAAGDGTTLPPNDPPYSAATANTHRVTKRFFIYSAWPRLEGIEGRAADPDADGVFSFSEFYDATYTVPGGGLASQFIGEQVPNRDFVSQLVAAARADHPDEEIRLIPVGEVFAAVDALIRAGQLPGIEAYFTRNAQYYLDARLDGLATLGAAGFTFLYPPGQPANYGSDFIAAQGVKNFYCDKVHMNDQSHNDERSGTVGAYLAAATVHATVTGRNPNLTSAAEVASLYEKFDAVADAALIAKLQEVVWDVVIADPRTGVEDLPVEATGYAGFKAEHFSPAQLANRLVSGEEADPDGDGLANVAEYFRQTDPLEPSAAAPVAIVPSGNGTAVSVTGLARPFGIHPRLEISGTLSAWSRVPLGDLVAEASETAGLADYAAEIAPAAKQFYRLGIGYVPDGPTLPIVSWGPGAEIVSGNQNLVAGKDSDSLGLSTPANPAIGASYSTTSPLFYAAAVTLQPGNTTGSYRVNNDSGGVADTLIASFSKNTAAELHAVFTAVWKQDGNGSGYGFLDGADSGDVTLASIQLRGRTNSATTSVPQTRFVVKDGGQWFLSSDCGAITAITGFDTIRLPDPHAVQWFAFDPDEHAEIGAPVATPAFDRVTAVGFQWRTYGTSTSQTLYLESFEARRADLD